MDIPAEMLAEAKSTPPFIICADHGASHAIGMGFVPDILVGDFDSLSPELLVSLQNGITEIIQYPEAKDFTDGEASLFTAKKQGAENIIIFGALGGREDHHLANILCAASYAKEFNSLAIYSSSFRIHVLEGEKTLFVENKKSSCLGQTFSLICLTDVLGLSVKGAKYPLSEQDIPFGSSWTVSNELLAEEDLSIHLRSGKMLAVFSLLGEK